LATTARPKTIGHNLPSTLSQESLSENWREGLEPPKRPNTVVFMLGNSLLVSQKNIKSREFSHPKCNYEVYR